jgi:ubiquinone biosynthesis protein
VLMRLFQTSRRFHVEIQPQLVLLQKTLLNIEGVGRQLDPNLDIWEVAKPVLERILRERYSPRRALKELRKRLPEIMTQAPDMPALLHSWLRQQVEGKHELAMRSQDIVTLNDTLKRMQRRVITAVTGVGLVVVSALLYGLQAGGPQLASIPVWSWITGGVGVLALASAWLRR